MPFDDVATVKQPRQLDFLKGKFNVPEDFDTMFEDEIVKMFEGEDDLPC